MTIFIGLTGVKTAGKTTAFNFLKEYDPNIIEITLAARLKNACRDCLGIPNKYLYMPELKEKDLPTFIHLTSENIIKVIEYFGVTPDYEKNVRPHIGQVFQTARRAAQYIGTEMMRSIDDNIHCRGAVLDLPSEGIFVITDIRFISEFEYFKKNFDDSFFPVYIKNNAAETSLDNHSSEKEVLKIAPKCRTIDNNGTLKNLKKQILKFYNEITIPNFRIGEVK